MEHVGSLFCFALFCFSVKNVDHQFVFFKLCSMFRFSDQVLIQPVSNIQCSDQFLFVSPLSYFLLKLSIISLIFCIVSNLVWGCDLNVKLFYRYLAQYNTQQAEFPNTIKEKIWKSLFLRRKKDRELAHHRWSNLSFLMPSVIFENKV